VEEKPGGIPMKILVCTDGSKQSKKAVEEAVKIARGCQISEVAVITVLGIRSIWADTSPYSVHSTDNEHLLRIEAEEVSKREAILAEAKKIFARNGIEARTILKRGNPAHTIAKTADEEEYDMIVIGRRGLGGLERPYPGSVSIAVLLEAKANVLVVN
jgi:nucleotide-binding universal stress UspA family protein